MGVYEDMANDAGYAFGTDDNAMMAAALQEQEAREYAAWQEARWLAEQMEAAQVEDAATPAAGQGET